MDLPPVPRTFNKSKSFIPTLSRPCILTTKKVHKNLIRQVNTFHKPFQKCNFVFKILETVQLCYVPVYL